MNVLFFDTETTGKYEFRLPPDHPSQPHLVQLAAVMRDSAGKERAEVNILIRPDGWTISEEVIAIHGISEEIASTCGVSLKTAAFLFNNLCYQADLLVAHNIEFDRSIMSSVYHRVGHAHRLGKINRYCTMRSATPVVKVPRPGGSSRPNDWKWPTLTECMKHFYKEDHEKAHDAMADVRACMRVYDALQERGA